MPVVSVRISPAVEAYLKRHKLKAGPFAKDLIEREVRYREFLESEEYLRKHRIKPKAGVPSSSELIRWDRDHGH